jgi:hypothetical protein
MHTPGKRVCRYFYFRKAKSKSSRPEEKQFMVDVVTKDYFDRYARIVEDDIGTIRAHFDRKKVALMEEVDHLVDLRP